MILKKPNKVKFDLNNQSHMDAFKKFYVNGTWGTPCPFELEAPYSNIPSMIIDKIVRNSFNAN